MRTEHIIEPAHDKTYIKTRITNKDSDLPLYIQGMARILVYPFFFFFFFFFDNLEAV